MPTQSVDVVIIGAGLSGIGAAYRLQTMCPGKTYTILEGRDSIGGTWDLFRYPGVRSDSDMYTLGYPFKPWKDPKAIADGPSILSYIKETAEENNIVRNIKFGHRVTAAEWSSETNSWTLTATVSGATEPATITASFLYFCSGYYSYDGGYTPDFPGRASFEGQVIHPQKWPVELDYAGKRVVIVGSGATAVTLVPAMAETAAHVTMLQRSPTYITALPSVDAIADKLRKHLPGSVAHRLVRWKNVGLTTLSYQMSRRRPDKAKEFFLQGIRKHLPEEFNLDPTFSPTYNPWDQRVCLVPDGDLFTAMKSGKASIVTDTISSFTPTGISVSSGDELLADIIVTATGLTLVPCGGVALTVDGVKVNAGETFMYKGFMLSGIPNMALCIGYANASWTLRADISSRNVCKLIKRMDVKGYAAATPKHPGETHGTVPVLGLNAGYVNRGAAALPKQGSKAPWVLRHNYILDAASARFTPLHTHLDFTDR